MGRRAAVTQALVCWRFDCVCSCCSHGVSADRVGVPEDKADRRREKQGSRRAGKGDTALRVKR